MIHESVGVRIPMTIGGCKRNRMTQFSSERVKKGDAEMIRQNSAKPFENDESEAHRVFTGILDAAEPYMEIYGHDYKNHVARGVLRTRHEGRRAILAFDPYRGTISVMVDFPISAEITLPWAMILFRLQRQAAAGTSTIIADPESSILRVGTRAPVPAPDVMQPVLVRAFRDTVRVIENSDFRSFAV
jgi:hypothetical protein